VVEPNLNYRHEKGARMRRQYVFRIGGFPAGVLGLALGLVLLAVAVTFWLALLILLAAGGSMLGAYLWWKARSLRRQVNAGIIDIVANERPAAAAIEHRQRPPSAGSDDLETAQRDKARSKDQRLQ